MKTVKVMEVPGAVREVALEDGNATVSAALSAAGITVKDGYQVKVDGQAASMETEVSEGSRVIVAKGAKGNA